MLKRGLGARERLRLGLAISRKYFGVDAMPFSRRSLLAGSAAAASAALVATANSQGADEPAVDPQSLDTRALGKTKNTKFAVNIEMWFGKTPYVDRFQKAADL